MSETIDCPLCKKPMVHRVNRKRGNEFFGCSDYPRCKGTRSLENAADCFDPPNDPPEDMWHN